MQTNLNKEDGSEVSIMLAHGKYPRKHIIIKKNTLFSSKVTGRDASKMAKSGYIEGDLSSYPTETARAQTGRILPYSKNFPKCSSFHNVRANVHKT